LAKGKQRDVVIIAPTPAPYRAYEYDLVQEGLKDRYRFHTLFLERHWAQMKWEDDTPKVMTWEVLPKSRISPLASRLPFCNRFNKGTTRRLNELNPSAVILHGHDAPALWAGFFWARRHNRGLLYRSDSNIIIDRSRPSYSWKNLVKRVPLSYMYRHIDAFQTIGTLNEEFYRYYHGDESRFFRCSYMVDTESFGNLAREEQRQGCPLKRELGITAEKVVLFVGRFVLQKNIMTLLRAFKQAKPYLKDTCLLLVGDGPLRNEVCREVEDIRDSVCITGFRQPQEVGRLYGLADVLVLPSNWEPYGLVVNEAMAAGLAVIASDQVAAAVDLVVPGRNGDVFPFRSVDALADSLKKVLADKATAQRMGKASRERLDEWNREFDVVRGYERSLDYAIGRHESRC